MRFPLRQVVASGLLLAVVGAPACKRLKPVDLTPLEQAGMEYRAVEQLRETGPSEAEVAEIALARRAGLSDGACLELVRLARGRNQPFAYGEAVANLLRVRFSEPNIVELARLDQLGLWVGEAQAMRLLGLSEDVVMTIARRRAQGLISPSGAALGQLKNTGAGEPQMLALINRGAGDAQVLKAAEDRRRALTPRGFARQRGRIPRR